MYQGMSLKGKCSCLLNIQSTLFRFSEQEKAIREKERVRKAKWRASKVKNDPQYIEKVRRYDRERKRNHTSHRYSTSHKDCTSRKDRNHMKAVHHVMAVHHEKIQSQIYHVLQ